MRCDGIEYSLSDIVQFWKQFFEASANVSLSGYEEAAENDDVTTEEIVTEVPEDYATPQAQRYEYAALGTATTTQKYRDEVSSLDSSSLATPHLTSQDIETRSANRGAANRDHGRLNETSRYSSPYEVLKQELQDELSFKSKPTASKASSSKPRSADPSDSEPLINRDKDPRTPGHARFQPPSQTPGAQRSPYISTDTQQRTRRTNPDPLLHRVLDKNYRVQATPHTARRTADTTRTYELSRTLEAVDSSPFSPDLAAPTLRAEIFGSPARPARAPAASRTPGISVQASARSMGQLPSERGPRIEEATFTDNKAWDSGSDADDTLGMSPPKTMQFHVPAGRLLQTPAREASKRIVDDLLLTAGGGASVTNELAGLDLNLDLDLDLAGWDEEAEAGPGLADDSPSIVRTARREMLEDDTF